MYDFRLMHVLMQCNTIIDMMKAVIQSGLAIFSVAQTTSFLQTAVIVGLEMLCADTAKMWQSPAVNVSTLFHDGNACILQSIYLMTIPVIQILCSIKPYCEHQRW